MEFDSNLTIDDLDLSVRAYNCLKNNGLTDVSTLLTLSLEDFFGLRNMGQKTAREVYQLLHNDADVTYDEQNVLPIGLRLSSEFVNFSKFVFVQDMQFNARATNAFSNLSISTLFELINIDLYSVENIGKGTIKEIKNVISNFINSEFDIELTKNSINGNFLDLCISKFPQYEEISLFKSNIKTVGDGFDIFLNNIDKIKNFENKEHYLIFKGFVKFKKMSSIDVSELILNRFKEKKIGEREIDIFSQRGLGITLETLGAQYNVERERIRQIDKKTLEKIKEFWENDEIIDYIGNRDFYCLEENNTLLNDFLYQLLIRRLDELSDYISLEINSNIYFFKKSFFEKQKSEFEPIACLIRERKIVDKVDIPSNSISDLLLTYFYELNCFEDVGTKIIVKTSKRDKVADFLKRKIVIDLSKDNIWNEIHEFSALYDVSIESERAFIGLVADVSYSLGGGKYTSIDNDPIISEGVLNDIFRDIDEKKFVKANVLFNKYKGKIENALSATHLYGFLKKNYDGKYNFGGTNLVIATLDTKTSNAARVLDLLQNSNGPINRDKIMLQLGLDTIGLNIIDSQNEDIIKWGRNNYYLKSKITLDDISKKAIENYLNKTNKFLLNDLLVYSQIKKLEFIEQNYIKDKYELNSFIQNCPVAIFHNFNFDHEAGIFIKEKNNDESSTEFEL